MLEYILPYKTLIVIFIVSLLICVSYVKYAFSFWKKKKVPYVHLGNLRNQAYLVQKPYYYFKATGHKFFGAYLLIKPFLVVTDLDLVKSILAKEAHHFTSHGSYYNEKDDPLSAHLFNLEGERWKNLRVKLTPTFTSGKMKGMFQTVVDCSKPLVKHVDDAFKNCESIDIKDVLTMFTTDVISSCAFGLECNSFINPNNRFRMSGKKLLEFDALKSLKQSFVTLFPELSRKLRLKLLESDVTKYFFDIINKTVQHRESNNITRKDLLQIIIDLKNNKAVDDDDKKESESLNLTMHEVAAQALVFFLAGFETSSTTMTYCLYELCLNVDIQERVRSEIVEVLNKHNGQLTYDALTEMTYMQQVIDEALRKYPPVSFLLRLCTKDYVIPDTDVTIEKGVHVFIPAYQMHHDKDYFEEPEEFLPERFSKENKQKIPQFAYIPFGEGPRMCIGIRFGMMQTKVGLTALLKNFRFALNEKTPYPLHFSHNHLVLTPAENILLDISKCE